MAHIQSGSKPTHAWLRSTITILTLLLASMTVKAIPLSEYHKKIQNTIGALDALTQSEEEETAEIYTQRFNQTVDGVRNSLPVTEQVEWNADIVNVDNAWLHRDLDEVGKAPDGKELVRRLRLTLAKLQAINEQLAKLDNASVTAPDKANQQEKLQQILSRPEFIPKPAEDSAFRQLLRRFLEFLQRFFGGRAPAASRSSAMLISRIAQIIVVLLALGVLLYVARLFKPTLRRRLGLKKKSKPQPRIVLGERLEPEQSALDLLSEADALARRGEIRSAIRKGYIALLVELGDRKVISLAQHKTNRDYLSSVRELEPLHGKMISLTNSFERYWYGIVQATEADWADFRTLYREALQG